MRQRRPEEVMPAYGLPEALLPAEVVSARFDDATGAFEVLLAGDVVRQVDRYRVRYRSPLRGVLSAGAVHGLKGVSVKRGLWVPVGAIEKRGDRLVFKVGPVTKSLPATAFDAT
jgi:hypothetical protein